MAVKSLILTTVEIPLSGHCKRILAFAMEEAEVLFHRHVNIGHLIAAMLREENGKAGQILRSAGLSLDAVRQQLSLDEAETE